MVSFYTDSARMFFFRLRQTMGDLVETPIFDPS